MAGHVGPVGRTVDGEGQSHATDGRQHIGRRGRPAAQPHVPQRQHGYRQPARNGKRHVAVLAHQEIISVLQGQPQVARLGVERVRHQGVEVPVANGRHGGQQGSENETARDELSPVGFSPRPAEQPVERIDGDGLRMDQKGERSEQRQHERARPLGREAGGQHQSRRQQSGFHSGHGEIDEIEARRQDQDRHEHQPQRLLRRFDLHGQIPAQGGGENQRRKHQGQPEQLGDYRRIGHARQRRQHQQPADVGHAFDRRSPGIENETLSAQQMVEILKIDEGVVDKAVARAKGQRHHTGGQNGQYAPDEAGGDRFRSFRGGAHGKGPSG